MPLILQGPQGWYTRSVTNTALDSNWHNFPFTAQSNATFSITGATIDNETVWRAWVTNAAATLSGAWTTWNVEVAQRKETRAQRTTRLALERREAEQAQARAEHALKLHAEAQAKAKKLLIEHLTPEQALTLAEKNYFDVQVGGKTYRIHQGTHGNVRLIEEGIEKTLYCVQPNDVPAEDAMLAQKLFLQCNEQEFLRLANARQLR